jgi:hypothetical protein
LASIHPALPDRQHVVPGTGLRLGAVTHPDHVHRWQRTEIHLHRALESLLEGVEFRFHRTVLYNSIYRADDQVLVNTHLFGVTAAVAPVWHLRKLPAGELAGLYVDSFERVWDTATPLDGA